MRKPGPAAHRCVPATLLTLALAACDAGSTAVPPPASGGVQATLDDGGGILVLAHAGGDLRLEVPAGALNDTVTLTAVPHADPLRGSLGPSFELGPSGLHFARPVKLLFRQPETPREVVVATQADGAWVNLDPAPAPEGYVAGWTTHFSPFGTPPAGCTDADGDGWFAIAATCPEGTDCDDGDNAVHIQAAESCNGADDDCDGVADEDFYGTTITYDDGGGPQNVLLGDPCDGTSDADSCEGGHFVCNSIGSEAACTDDADPEVETCDGEDDDCDGLTDEGFNVGGPCDGPDNDLCANGAIVCDLATGTAVCDESGPLQVESCNGIDDDCDGLTDEDVDPGTACDGSDADQCANGTLICDGSGNIVCDEPGPGVSEICDGQDNDCDGLTDEDFALGLACDGADTDLCNEGVTVCNAAQDGTVCQEASGDDVEICGNALDDDCNPATPDIFDVDADGLDCSQDCNDTNPYCGADCSDPDGDGRCGIHDNCPAVANPQQHDGDNDGLGNACDPLPPLILAPTSFSTLDDCAPEISGSAAPGTTALVYLDGVEVLAAPAASNGYFSQALPRCIDDGAHVVWATTRTPEGLVSARSDGRLFTVDTGLAVGSVISLEVAIADLGSGGGVHRVPAVSVDPDCDGDGLGQSAELALGTDVIDPGDAEADPDGDGVTTRLEHRLGTDSGNPDSDGDSHSDGDELLSGSDPLNPAEVP